MQECIATAAWPPFRPRRRRTSPACQAEIQPSGVHGQQTGNRRRVYQGMERDVRETVKGGTREIVVVVCVRVGCTRTCLASWLEKNSTVSAKRLVSASAARMAATASPCSSAAPLYANQARAERGTGLAALLAHTFSWAPSPHLFERNNKLAQKAVAAGGT